MPYKAPGNLFWTTILVRFVMLTSSLIALKKLNKRCYCNKVPFLGLYCSASILNIDVSELAARIMKPEIS